MLLKLNFKQWFSAPHVTGCLFVERKESWNAGAVTFPAEQLYLFTSPRSALRVPSAFTCAQLAVVREGPKNPWSGLFCTDGISAVLFQLLGCFGKGGLKNEGPEEGWGR